MEIIHKSLCNNTTYYIVKKDEIWFDAIQTASALGYKHPKKAVGDHCKEFKKDRNELVTATVTNSTNGSKLVTKTVTNSRGRPGPLVNEAGFYNLVLNSKLPSAKKFTNWVVTEVLPSIRKTGHYKYTAKAED